MDQLVQIVGAVLILTAFVLAQLNRWSTGSAAYLVLNLVGSVLLAAVAVAGRDIGFVLLETVWAGVSAVGLVKRVRGEPASGPDLA